MRLRTQIWKDGGLHATFSEALLRWSLRIDDQHWAEMSIQLLSPLWRLVIDCEGGWLFTMVIWLAVVGRLAAHRFSKLVIKGRVGEGQRGVLKLLLKGWLGHVAKTWVARETVVAAQVASTVLRTSRSLWRLWTQLCAWGISHLYWREMPLI